MVKEDGTLGSDNDGVVTMLSMATTKTSGVTDRVVADDCHGDGHRSDEADEPGGDES